MTEDSDWALDLPTEEAPAYWRRVRVSYRCEVATQGRPQRESRGTPWRARTCNLSQSGVGLLLERPVEVASILQIVVFTPAANRVTIQGRVVHSTRLADGQWLVGCALRPALSPEEMAILL
jgi:hypothetical protein